MTQNRRFRKGWENEHLAKFILSKFSFVGEPTTIGDDVGTDLFCTMFIIEGDSLIPRNSFAIQIKSNKNKLEITKKTSYYKHLELPYFIGVVDQDNLKIRIYSGESILHFFTSYGDPSQKGNMHYNEKNKIFIELIDKAQDRVKLIERDSPKFTLKFPFVMEFDVKSTYESSKKDIEELFNICTTIQKNISANKSQTYIYEICGGSGMVAIYTGGGSVNVFENNFLIRLAEAFHNLNFIYDTGIKKFEYDKFITYEKIYIELNNIYKLPPILTTIYELLSSKIKKDGKYKKQ